jgi:hypothetical protein
MHFSNENTLFFLLNILGHDIYHDYAGAENKSRIAAESIQYLNSIAATYGGAGRRRTGPQLRRGMGTGTETIPYPSYSYAEVVPQRTMFSQGTGHILGTESQGHVVNNLTEQQRSKKNSQKMLTGNVWKYKGTGRLKKFVLAKKGADAAASKFMQTIKDPNGNGRDAQEDAQKQIRRDETRKNRSKEQKVKRVDKIEDSRAMSKSYIAFEESRARSESLLNEKVNSLSKVHECVMNITEEIQISFIFNAYQEKFNKDYYIILDIVDIYQLTIGAVDMSGIYRALLLIYFKSVYKNINYKSEESVKLNIFLNIIAYFIANKIPHYQQTVLLIDAFLVFLSEDDDIINGIVHAFFLTIAKKMEPIDAYDVGEDTGEIRNYLDSLGLGINPDYYDDIIDQVRRMGIEQNFVPVYAQVYSDAYDTYQNQQKTLEYAGAYIEAYITAYTKKINENIDEDNANAFANAYAIDFANAFISLLTSGQKHEDAINYIRTMPQFHIGGHKKVHIGGHKKVHIGGAIVNDITTSGLYQEFCAMLNELIRTQYTGPSAKREPVSLISLKGYYNDFTNKFAGQLKTINEFENKLKNNIKYNSSDKIASVNDILTPFFTEKLAEYNLLYIAARDRETAAALVITNANISRQEIADAKAAAQALIAAMGGVTQKHTKLRDDFIQTIIKMTLMNCNIYPCSYSQPHSEIPKLNKKGQQQLNITTGVPIMIVNNGPDILDTNINMHPAYADMDKTLPDNIDLYTELNLLIKNTTITYPTNGNWVSLPQEADVALYNHFKTNIPNTHFKITGALKYVISNAAIFSSTGNLDYKDVIFSPVSTLLDGAGSSADNELEKGNMDFKIGTNTDSAYYRGICTFSGNVAGNATYDYNLDIRFPNGIGLALNKNMAIKTSSKDLTASKVLIATLGSLAVFIAARPPGSLGIPVKPPTRGIFDHYFRYFHNNGPFIAAMYSIAFKATGDLFQEVNAACKIGGYTAPPDYAQGRNIVPWGADGNALRGFGANDQPSGCRFIKMIRDGRPDQINKKAFGGYMGDAKQMVYYKYATITYLGGNHIKTRISRRKPRFSKGKHRISRRKPRISRRKPKFSRRSSKRKTRK